jgi:hypothetical protein
VDRRLGSGDGIVQVDQLHQHRTQSRCDQVRCSPYWDAVGEASLTSVVDNVLLVRFVFPGVKSAIVDRYGGHPAVLGIEPVNEPWQFTPIDVLKRFYWEGYLIVKRSAPYWKYIMHDCT